MKRRRNVQSLVSVVLDGDLALVGLSQKALEECTRLTGGAQLRVLARRRHVLLDEAHETGERPAVEQRLETAPLVTRPTPQPTLTSVCVQLRVHTRTFNGPLSGTTRVSRYQKGKTNLDFTEATDSDWQWHQLGHMHVCTSLQTDNHASMHCSVFTGRMHFLPPNQQCQSTVHTSYRIRMHTLTKYRPGGGKTICPPPPMAVGRWHKSRRICVRPRTGPQSAHL